LRRAMLVNAIEFVEKTELLERGGNILPKNLCVNERESAVCVPGMPLQIIA